MTKAGRLLGYARVSTQEQSLDLQLNALRQAGCVEIYEDHGVSAIAKSRPAFDAVLAKLATGDCLCIWKIDRAFRSVLHSLTVLEELERRQITFISITDNIDTNTPVGRFVYQIQNAFSELERAYISERTKAGLSAAKARGVRLGRPCLLSAKDKRLAAIEHARGVPISKIASRLGVSRMTVSRAVAA